MQPHWEGSVRDLLLLVSGETAHSCHGSDAPWPLCTILCRPESADGTDRHFPESDEAQPEPRLQEPSPTGYPGDLFLQAKAMALAPQRAAVLLQAVVLNHALLSPPCTVSPVWQQSLSGNFHTLPW